MKGLVLAVCAALVFASCGGAPGGAPAAGSVAPATPKTPLKVGFLEDPSRDAIVWAITHGKVTSQTVEPSFSFLALAQIIQAATTKQFDVVEAAPVIVPRTQGQLDLRVLSSGLVNKEGTILYTSASSPLRSPAELKGKTVAVPSLGGTFVLETRYVLGQKYGLNVALPSGDVKFIEAPPETYPQLLKDGKIDAAVIFHLPAYKLKDDPAFRRLSNITQEFQEQTKRSSVNSIVVTYGETAQAKGAALAELNRMLRASLDYFRANREAVIADVAKTKSFDPGFLAWWWSLYDYSLGDVSEKDKAEITATWEAAKRIGDIKEVPKIDDLLYRR